MNALFEELYKNYVVSDQDYGEYLRLELRRRQLEDEIKKIRTRQSQLSSKIVAIWEWDQTKNYKLGKATFFTKNNLIVKARDGVTEDEVVEALELCGYDKLINSCVDWRELRREISKLGSVPTELTDLLNCWSKKDLYVRVAK